MVKWTSQLRQFAGRHAGSFTLVVVGVANIVMGVVIRNDPAVAVPLVLSGSGLVALGSTLPDAEEVSAGKEGFRLRKRTSVPTAEIAATGELPEAGADEELPEEVARAQMALAANSLRQILEPEQGPLAGAVLHLYLYDAADDRLRALGVSGPPGTEGWAPGTGATGTAYKLGEYVLATGDAVRDATYGLTPEQQARAADLAVVAAMPVTNASREVIGVLTAASEDSESAIASSEGFDAQIYAAQMIARVLVDVLKWAPDAYDEG